MVKMSNIAYTVLWLETTIKILHVDYIEKGNKISYHSEKKIKLIIDQSVEKGTE